MFFAAKYLVMRGPACAKPELRYGGGRLVPRIHYLTTKITKDTKLVLRLNPFVNLVLFVVN